MKSLLPITASDASMVSCHSCSLLFLNKGIHRLNMANMKCHRCGAILHERKQNSLNRTVALLVAAFIFYIPANVLPVMTVTSFGREQADTIMSGVIHLVVTGMWPPAIVVFIASIIVPVMKLLILTFLVISVKKKSNWRPLERTYLYRMTEISGRWSMIDIFVITILIALVDMGSMATVEAESGALFFAAVVIITMFAAMSFDPRLIWDGAGKNAEPRGIIEENLYPLEKE